MDTKGPEIRSGFFKEGVDKLHLKKGENIILTSDYDHLAGADAKKLGCSYKKLCESVLPGQPILVADGSLVLTVVSINADAGEVTCKIENNAAIGERKNMNLPGVKVELPTFTEKDVDDIVNFGIKNNVDFIAASFVRKASDVTNLRQLLADNNGQHIKIISKIENQEGLENYNEILEVTDGIMVARGDLGMEIPPSKVFLAQKYMIREANIAGKPCITATQMLESMITNPRPTRAECSDVANAVFDGTDCVMLSGETANGPYFKQAVEIMAITCVEAEGSRNYNSLFQSIRNSTINRYGSLSPGESLASSAVKTAIDVNAKLVVVLSSKGTTPRYVAKFRPGRMVIVLTTNPTIARQSNGVYQGVVSFVVDSLEDSVLLAQQVSIQAIVAGIAKEGDQMVVVGRQAHGAGTADHVRVDTISTAFGLEGYAPHATSIGRLSLGFRGGVVPK